MIESRWVCERCGMEFDLEKGEGWVALTGDQDSYHRGKLTQLIPYEKVCYECADEILTIVEKCDKQCQNCEITTIWGLSIMDCLKFQLKFDLIDLPKEKLPVKSSLEEAKEILRIFNRF